MTDFDLLIIGAGPAGSFAAELLAKGGANVALFDGRPEGEPKACGGGVTAKALKGNCLIKRISPHWIKRTW